jgi:ATP-binding protein involved in chromosome partitioning
MAITKDAMVRAVGEALGAGGGSVLWASVCDTFASVKLELSGGATRAEFDAAAARAHAGARALAAREGSGLDSFIVEFVDHGGKVVHSARWGGMKGEAKPVASAPAGAGAGAPTGGGPAGGSAGGSGGHTPIGGLRGAAPTAQGAAEPLAGVGHIIAVGAGKGGVGKSTIALNLAVGLARRGHAVGLLDADIYGPSMPTMLGLATLDAIVHQGMLQPFYTHGVKAITIGKLVDADKPLIWRGPMAHGAFKQLAEQTQWGELDYLVIDLPPGTGDVSLTMAQMLRLTGAVVVCTPQKVAQDDAVRAAKMFQQLGVEVLGVVENMSGFVGDDGKTYEIFGRGGAEVMAQRLGVPFLGAVPITMGLRANSDSGDPTSNFTGGAAGGTVGLRAGSPAAKLRDALEAMITNLEGQVALASMRQGRARPRLTIH